MKRKKVIAVCLALVMVSGLVLTLTTDAARDSDQNGNSRGNGISVPVALAEMFGALRPSGRIRSDGRTFPFREINAVPLATDIQEGESLPVVGDVETLLRLLKDRGALYDGSAQLYDGFMMWRTAGDMEFATEAAPVPASAPDAPMAEAEMDSVGGAAFSETNEQVEGVSEGDIVKTDGRYIYAMSPLSNTLRIIHADGADLDVVSTITFDDVWGAEFYLIGGDRLAVVGAEHVPLEALLGDGELAEEPSTRCFWFQGTFTKLIIYDIADRSAPTELRRVSMDGWSVSTRVIGNIVYLVTNKNIWGVPFDQADSHFILPFNRDTIAGGDYSPMSLDRVFYVPDTDDASYLIIGAIDVYSDEPFEPVAYLGAGSDLYMSMNAMYVTKHRWVEAGQSGGDMVDGWFPGSLKTDIMRFAIDGTTVRYTGMGTVDGSPINQYSMDEYNGYFRIATTDWDKGTYVTVLDTADMRTIGRTEALAPGEHMHSMRFMGDMGYVVTFLNVDPLFTIDLSDPYNPRMLAELKIPGFSQYLHPVGEGLLLGIGRDTQELFTRDADGVETVVGFQDTGLKASLFDVSDPFDPIEVNVLLLGEGWTEVSHNPRALMCDPSRNLYGFVMENRGSWSSDALLLRVEDGRISIAATLDTGGNFQASAGRLCFIGDTLYLVHDTGVIVYDYDTFARIGSIAF